MARQVIQTGTLDNDGTGEGFKGASTKTNTNFGELYNHVGGDSDVLPTRNILHRNVVVTADGAINSANDYVVFDNDSAMAVTLSDGVALGEHKILSNRGAGTVTVTPTNFAHGTSFAIATKEACSIVWDSDEWLIYGNYSQVTVT